MKNKSKNLLMSLMIIILSVPSICFSKSKTIEGEYCDVYLGVMKNKKELSEFRKSVRRMNMEFIIAEFHGHPVSPFTIGCYSYIISNFLEKVVVVSHTEKGRTICDKIKITSDPEVIKMYLSQRECKSGVDVDGHSLFWEYDIDKVLIRKSEKINIGLIIETKIPDIDENKREQLEDEQEKEFHRSIGLYNDKYKIVDRKHLSKVIEEQKLSSSGITDSETVKLGRILNLDIIVLRILYDGSETTKVLKVDTGEVLLVKTYTMKPKIIIRD